MEIVGSHKSHACTLKCQLWISKWIVASELWIVNPGMEDDDDSHLIFSECTQNVICESSLPWIQDSQFTFILGGFMHTLNMPILNHPPPRIHNSHTSWEESHAPSKCQLWIFPTRIPLAVLDLSFIADVHDNNRVQKKSPTLNSEHLYFVALQIRKCFVMSEYNCLKFASKVYKMRNGRGSRYVSTWVFCCGYSCCFVAVLS